MAYGILRKLLADEGITSIDVRTSGVMTIPGLLPTQECRHLLEKESIDISNHRSSQMTAEVLKRAALVLGMTSFHVQMALRMTESARGKTFLFKEFTGSDPKNGQVQDPMGCTMEVYRKVYREVRLACKRLIKTDLMQELIARANAMEKRRIRPRAPGELPPPPTDLVEVKAKKIAKERAKPAKKPAAKPKAARAKPSAAGRKKKPARAAAGKTARTAPRSSAKKAPSAKKKTASTKKRTVAKEKASAKKGGARRESAKKAPSRGAVAKKTADRAKTSKTRKSR